MKLIDINNLKKFWQIINQRKQDSLPKGEPGQSLVTDENGSLTWRNKYIILKSQEEYIALDTIDPDVFYLIEEDLYDTEESKED